MTTCCAVLAQRQYWVNAGHPGSMRNIEYHREPTPLPPRAISEYECDRFRKRNLCQPGRGLRVHDVEFREWNGGLKMPTPACRQPVDPVKLVWSGQAVSQPVDCKRCLALDPNPRVPLIAIDGGQLPLDFDVGDDS